MDDLSKKDMVEGPEAFERFDSLVGKVLSVPREEILRRDAEHKKAAHLRGKKRGPKPKAEPATNNLVAQTVKTIGFAHVRSIRILAAVVVAKRLLIYVPGQMERLDRNVGPAQASLQEPEIVQAVVSLRSKVRL